MSTLTELFNTPVALSYKRDSIRSAIHVTSFTLTADATGDPAIYHAVVDGESITLGLDELDYKLGDALLRYVTGTPSSSRDKDNGGAVWDLDVVAMLLTDNDVNVQTIIRFHHRKPTGDK